jgi:thioredoxin-like negative regulator of GroEL
VLALATAMEALDAKDFAQALDVARTTRRAHPTGALRPELTLLEVEALCGLSRVDEAQDVVDAMPLVDRTALVQERPRRTCVSLK